MEELIQGARVGAERKLTGKFLGGFTMMKTSRMGHVLYPVVILRVGHLMLSPSMAVLVAVERPLESVMELRCNG